MPKASGGTEAKWTTEAVAKRLGLQTNTYENREMSHNAFTRAVTPPHPGTAVDVTSLAAIAYVMGTSPGFLLMPDQDVLQRDRPIELRDGATGDVVDTVSAQDFALWILGLVPLPGQAPGFFDVASRIIKDEQLAGNARGVAAGPLDPLLTSGEPEPDDWSGSFDPSVFDNANLGSRALSACRALIRHAAVAEAYRSEGNSAAADDVDQVAAIIGDQMIAMLSELGGRLHAKRAVQPTT